VADLKLLLHKCSGWDLNHIILKDIKGINASTLYCCGSKLL